MKIQVGRSYVTRNGGRVVIERLSGNNSYPFEGRLETNDQEDPRHAVLWNKDGRYINRFHEDADDLIKECV